MCGVDGVGYAPLGLLQALVVVVAPYICFSELYLLFSLISALSEFFEVAFTFFEKILLKV